MIDINDVLNGTFSQTRRYDCSPALYDQIVTEIETIQIDEEQAENIARFLDQSAADLARRVLSNISGMRNNAIGHANLVLLIKAGIFKRFLTRVMRRFDDHIHT